ncbi:MAG: hypothetical protein NC925_02825, partial [Candidatus Omnitrophica bacterium]|nr:hypothetical protein [Candidatus Omnitrophota bacterium]
PIIEDIISVKKSKSYILNASEFCEVLKEIINNPEKHTYFQWLIFARHMANLSLLGYTWAEEKFHELASKYFDYDRKQNEKLFKYYVDKGFAFLSCKLLKSDVCKNCPNKSGTPYSYRDIFMVQNLVERDGKFYKVLDTQYGHLEEYLCPAFHIEEELKIEGKKDKDFYIVLNVNGEKKLINGNNYKKEIIAELDSGNYSPKEVNLIIDQYLHETKIKRLKNIFFVRKIKNQIDYFEDGFDILTYDEEYLEFLIKSRIVPHHVYMKKGNSQVFFEEFKKLFKIDIPIRIITSFSLIQELYNTKYTFTTNPILLISGAPSSGKTKRLHIVQSFWTKPESTARISEKDLSPAYLLYTHSKVRVPLWIDDLKFDDAKDAERLIFTLSNQNRRSIALSNFISEPLRSVTIATLENNTLNVFKPFFETETGFIRRFLLLQIKDTEKENKQELIELIDKVWTLALENYGHAKFFYDGFRFDEELYIQIRNKVREVPLIYDGFYDLLAGLITYDIKMHEFLGLECNIEEEIKLFASHLGILKESEYDVLYSKDIENKFDKYLHITHKNISYILDHYNLRNKPIQLLGKFTLDYKQIFKSLTEPDISGEIIKVLLFNFSLVKNNPKFILSTQLYSVRALLSSDMHDALIENTLKFIVNNFSNYKVYFPEKVRMIENMVEVDFLTYILYCYLSYLLQTDPFKVNKFITKLEGNYKNQVKINMLKSLIEGQQAEYKEEIPQAEGTSDEPDIPF